MAQRDTICLVETIPIDEGYALIRKAPHPNTTTLGIRLQDVNFGKTDTFSLWHILCIDGVWITKV